MTERDVINKVVNSMDKGQIMEPVEDIAQHVQGINGVSEMLQVTVAIGLLTVMTYTTVGLMFGIGSTAGALFIGSIMLFTGASLSDKVQTLISPTITEEDVEDKE